MGLLVVLGSMAADLGTITWSQRHGITSMSHCVTFCCLVLGGGATAPSQLPDTKSEAINRRSTNLARQGISHVLWDRHRLSLQISSVRLKTR